MVNLTDGSRHNGISLDEAIQKAGQMRFLHSVLTMLTAIGGLLSLALQGSGAVRA